MYNIDEKSHTSVIVKSLEKIYNLAKVTGKLNVRDIYILSILYKLMDNLDLEGNDLRCITDLYNSIAFKSNTICSPIIYKSYTTTKKPKFVQAECEDCNEIPVSLEPIVLEDVIITLQGELQDDEFGTVLYHNHLEDYLSIVSNPSTSTPVTITVTSLPNDGELLLNGQPVMPNQALTIAEFNQVYFDYAIVTADYPTRQDQTFTYFITDNNVLNSNTVIGTIHLESDLIIPFVINAGNNQSLDYDTTETSLTANVVNYGNGTSLTSVVWEYVGNVATITNPNTLTTGIEGLTYNIGSPRGYIFKITATNNVGQTAEDTVTVQIAAYFAFYVTTNYGSTVTLDPGETSISLNGVVDNIGMGTSVVDWSWNLDSGSEPGDIPFPIIMSPILSQALVVNGLYPDRTYVFSIAANNNAGQFDSTPVQVHTQS